MSLSKIFEWDQIITCDFYDAICTSFYWPHWSSLWLVTQYWQDGEIWTFSVRAFDSTLPERTINVNYDGFAEGYYHKNIFWFKRMPFDLWEMIFL